MRCINALFPPIMSLWNKINMAIIIPDQMEKKKEPEEQEMFPITPASGETKNDRAYKQVRRQLRELQKELLDQKEIIKKLTDSSESSDAGGGRRLRPIPLLTPSKLQPSSSPPLEEMYESEIVPADLLKDSSLGPRPLNSLMHKQRKNEYTNTTLLKSVTATDEPLPTAPPMPTAAPTECTTSTDTAAAGPNSEGNGRAKLKVLFNLCKNQGKARAPLGPPQNIYVEPEEDSSATPLPSYKVEDKTATAHEKKKKKQKVAEVDKTTAQGIN